MEDVKRIALSVLGIIGSAFATALGGWDWALQTLIIFISADFILGLLVAAVWGKSTKSATGKLESGACRKGLMRKGGMLLIVLIAARLDLLIGTDGFCRTAVILYFIGNEGISIIENLSCMGVPFPSWLKDKFETLRAENDKKE